MVRLLRKWKRKRLWMKPTRTWPRTIKQIVNLDFFYTTYKHRCTSTATYKIQTLSSQFFKSYCVCLAFYDWKACNIVFITIAILSIEKPVIRCSVQSDRGATTENKKDIIRWDNAVDRVVYWQSYGVMGAGKRESLCNHWTRHVLQHIWLIWKIWTLYVYIYYRCISIYCCLPHVFLNHHARASAED